MRYGNDEFEEELGFNEEDIYSELGDEDFQEDSGTCVECGSVNGIMGFDPYSESAGAVYYCSHCMPEDFEIIWT